MKGRGPLRSALAASLAALVLMVEASSGAVPGPAFSAAGAAEAHQAAPAQLALLHQRCVADRVAQTCRVTNTQPLAAAGSADKATATLDAEAVIFVAGVGAVSASLYAELQAAGEAMCQTVRSACEQHWAGARCGVARALYGLKAEP